MNTSYFRIIYLKDRIDKFEGPYQIKRLKKGTFIVAILNFLAVEANTIDSGIEIIKETIMEKFKDKSSAAIDLFFDTLHSA